jgi:hypothetical protein
MSRLRSPLTNPSRARHAAIASLLAAAALTAGTGAFAQTTPAPMAKPAAMPVHHPYRHHHMATRAVVQHHETIDERISTLHTRLNITPAEEAAWTPVAQAMRDNHAAMQRMLAARRAEAPHDQTAVEDLRTYERFTQAHVDGLKTLIASFETLYAQMPAAQQATADHVFKTFGHRDHAMKS